MRKLNHLIYICVHAKRAFSGNSQQMNGLFNKFLPPFYLCSAVLTPKSPLLFQFIYPFSFSQYHCTQPHSMSSLLLSLTPFVEINVCSKYFVATSCQFCYQLIINWNKHTRILCVCVVMMDPASSFTINTCFPV